MKNSLNINGTQETIITAHNLFYQTSPISTFSRNIIYTVLKPPAYGLLYVAGHPEYAKEQDSFTQNDLDSNKIIFRTHRTCYSSFIDEFEFIVTVAECDDVKGTIKIVYNPPEELRHAISYQTRERIQLNEGDRTLLTRRNFQIIFNKFNYLLFKLSAMPRHGMLCSLDSRSGKHKMIETFTLENLYLDDIYYCHDDSESTEDAINMLVLTDDQMDFQFVCEVIVSIYPLNDNRPYRVQTDATVFHVVRNESKMLSTQVLEYLDEDANTNRTEIQYVDVRMTNGEVYNRVANDPTVAAAQFTQDDLDHGRIWLRHIGSDAGLVTFKVTDGSFQVDGSVKVVASDPFIKIAEKNASFVQESKFIVLQLNDLSIETNLNSAPDEIEYRVLDEPKYGVLKILRRKFNGTTLPRSSNITSIRNFTQQDVERERLIYWNTAVASMEKIRFVRGVKFAAFRYI